MQGQDPQASSDPVVQLKHQHGEEENFYLIQVRDPVNGLRMPVESLVPVKNNGEGINLSDEEDNDRRKKMEELEWINYRRAL